MKILSHLSPTDRLGPFIQRLFPDPASFQVLHLEIGQEELLLEMASTRSEGVCPICGQRTARVHSRYQRTLQDVPCCGLQVELRLHVRRFFCANTACTRHIFTERLPTLTEPSARRTTRLREVLLALGWVLGGAAGARQSCHQAMPICGATLLSLLRRWGGMSPPIPRVLGVDDWGFKRGHVSGTILVDLEHHRPVDLLLGSDEQVLAQWLRLHPGVQVISRDRSAEYQRGATQEAPDAQQVLDRWHLLKNLGEVLQKVLSRQMEVLRQAGQEVQQMRQMAPSVSACVSAEIPPKQRTLPPRKPPAPSPRRTWQMMMYQQVHEHAAQGETHAHIARSLHLNRRTVRKYLRMPTFETHYRSPRRSGIEAYRAYVQARWQQGEVRAKRLWQELQAQGFAGCYSTVWAFVRDWPRPEEKTSTASTPGQRAPHRGPPTTRTPRQAMWLLLRPQEQLKEPDAAYRGAMFRLCPALEALSSLGQELVRLVHER
jgi:transposase